MFVEILGVLFISVIWLAVAIHGLHMPEPFIYGIVPVVILWVICIIVWLGRFNKSK